MKASLIKKLKKIQDKKNKLYTLNDLKLPQFLYRKLPVRDHAEPLEHYLFKTKLGHSIDKYFRYNLNEYFNTELANDPYLSSIRFYNQTYEYIHYNVKVVSPDEAEHITDDGRYYYRSDILLLLEKLDETLYHIFVEINGGIHTKNKYQKTKNRMRYEAIKDSYQNRDTNMVMIIFEGDEYQHHTMDYFINIIMDTLRNKKERYPEKFLFELRS